jgi:hypothetical protein
MRVKRGLVAVIGTLALGLAAFAPGTAEVAAQECHPDYVECVPYYEGDALNCEDVGHTVTLYDPNYDAYGLDGWNYVDDGFGCEMFAYG